ncbi:glycosyltransferase family 4 protein [uncultured Polaribacter sp.]|uniref:glycosyltransferase family 4 protein n=1 Tax=uncultured Polaribacter sp. TaxID=174711 RepID=UPI00260D3CED|nr:glycosyltransferase [uncultured Polaribacter sp.]
MKILIFIDWFLPGYKAGGPIQSIANFVSHFGHEFEISIVTSNKDLGEVLPYANIKPNVWLQKENYRIKYLDTKTINTTTYKKLLNEEAYDSVYFNSLFSVYFSLLPLWFAVRYKKRVVLAPRGMLGAGALKLSKRKKQVVIWLLKLTGIPKKIAWQGTAVSEIDEINKCFGEDVHTHLAPNLSAKMAVTCIQKEKQENNLKLFFLSRISVKKNLIGALNFLKEVNKQYQITFTIIGPVGEESYWEECELLIKKRPNNITIHVVGAIPNLELPKLLSEQHVLLLPTFHENFGHVILEAFQQGCPVILSDQTPWKLLKEQQIGYDIPLGNSKNFTTAIEVFAKMKEDEYQEWSLNAFDFAKKFCNSKEIIEANRTLFNK